MICSLFHVKSHLNLSLLPLVGLLIASIGLPALAQPGFDSYHFDSPLQHYTGDVDALYNADPKAFYATYLPKLTIPLRRDDYFGVWNYRNHNDSWPWSGDHFIPYDNDSDKRTYRFSSGSGHDATDWLVSFRNWGANEVINPFPNGAVVKVTSAHDSGPDVPDTWSLGNTLELTCYLDGDATNSNSNNRFRISFAHLKQHSIVVSVGDFVVPGQVLAQVGNSGATSLDVTHIHTRYHYKGKRLDPFNGYWNKDLSEPLLFDQGWVESKTNFVYRENLKHLTLNDAFYVEMPNQSWNTYTFKAFHEIDHIRIGDGNGGIEPGLDILDNPNLSNLRRSTYTFTDNDGSNWTVHEVRFRWYQDAHASVLNNEVEFLIETPNGDLSNRVFVKVVD